MSTQAAQPARYRLTAWQGSTFRKVIALLTGGLSSPVQNLTGYTASMPIRTVVDGTPVYTLSTSNNSITIAGGTLTLYIPVATILGFTWVNGIYDLTITDAGGSGDSATVLWGPFQIQGIGG